MPLVCRENQRKVAQQYCPARVATYRIALSETLRNLPKELVVS